MTVGEALKKYYSEIYKIELEGSSATQIVRDIFKKKYGIDVDGNSVSAILLDAISKSFIK